jgi:hypothetical protein
MQTHYDHKAKSLLKVSNAINGTTAPAAFMTSGVVDDALQILRNYHKVAIAESTKSREIENDVILALVGLRSDLSQKIKEIKGLSGDFKNSVDKEMESTRRAVNTLQDGLGQSDIDPSQMVGKQDPYLLKLAVDRQVEKQIDEENYLHQVSNWLPCPLETSLTRLGISQPRSLRPRVGSYCSWRNTKVLQRVCRYHQARGRRCLCRRRRTALWTSCHAKRLRVECVCRER